MPTAPPSEVGSCAPWILPADLARCHAVSAIDDCDPLTPTPALTQQWTDAELAQAATDMLYRASGYRFPGVCVETVWPRAECSHGLGVDWCTCSAYPVIDIGTQWPLLGVLSVRIDGVAVPTAQYRVDDWSRIVRLADPITGENPGWPTALVHDGAPPTDGRHSLSVTYTYGRAVPTEGRIAALALACNLRSWTTPVQQLFGENVTSASFGGLSISVESASEALKNGRTGILAVDRFLAPAPLGYGMKSVPAVGIWSPGLAAVEPIRRTSDTPPVLPGGGGGGTGTPATAWTDTFTPTAGQTLFGLSNVITLPASVEVTVNGQSFDVFSGAFTLAGQTVTWTAAYTLDPSDTVTVSYS
jgi:hypothetical protein